MQNVEQVVDQYQRTGYARVEQPKLCSPFKWTRFIQAVKERIPGVAFRRTPYTPPGESYEVEVVEFIKLRAQNGPQRNVAEVSNGAG